MCLCVSCCVEANAVVKKAEAEAKAVEMRGTAEADALRKQLEALAYTPGPEWLRLLQVSPCSFLVLLKNTICFFDWFLELDNVMDVIAALPVAMLFVYLQ